MNKFTTFLALIFAIIFVAGCATDRAESPVLPTVTLQVAKETPVPTPTIALPSPTATAIPPTPTSEPRAGTVLLIFGNRFIHEIYQVVRPALEEAGYEVVVASRTLEPIQAKNVNLEVEVDLLLEDVDVSDYDAILFHCDNDITFGSALDETNRIAQEAVEQGVLLAAICSGPRVLAYAQVVDGKTVTGEPSQTCQMLEDAGGTCTGKSVERDGLMITAKDRYASRTFVETIIDVMRESSANSAPSADGQILFYSERDGNAEIYTMQPDGGDPRRLTFNPFEDGSPVWSPDGLQIAFISNRDDPNPANCFPECFYQLYIINADGSDEHKLIETKFTTHHPDWHPEGTKLSFDTEFNLQGDIYVVDGEGNNLQLLIEDGFWADWSPDGSQIAFASNRDGNVEIYLADADGSNQRRLTDNPRMDLFPAWSPDGQKIAFMAGDGRLRQLFVMDADGSDEQQLTDWGRVSEDPAWSPDGEQIVFQSERDGNYEIYTINVEAALQGMGEPQRLTNTTTGDYWPSWGGVTTQKLDNSGLSFEKSAQAFASIPTWKIGLADLDVDGDLDAVFANAQANDSQVWLNDGSGFFVDSGQSLGKYGHGIDIGDLDGDGDPDVVITTHTFAPTRVYLNTGDAVFEELDRAFKATTGHSVDLFDLDEDGDLDAIGEGSGIVSLYLNDGQGYFTAKEFNFPLISAWGDLDADGDVDVLIKEDQVGYTVHLNDGFGNFTLYWHQADPAAMDIGDMALGDVDADGDLDAVITNGFHQTTSLPTMVFISDGSGQFTDSGQRLSAVFSAGVSLGDLDNDGDLDLVLTDYMQPCQVWLNDGAGQFSDSGIRFGDGQFYRHAHLGDLDGDGDLDIFLAAFGMSEGPNEIWFNQLSDKPVVTPGDDPLLALQPITRENAENLQLLRTLEIPGYDKAQISQCSVAFSPDSTLLVGACGNNPVPVWEVQSGQLIHTLYTAPQQIVACTFSPDGETIACGGFDETITLWDAKTGERVGSIDGLAAPIWDLAFSPDGASLASCSLGRAKDRSSQGNVLNRNVAQDQLTWMYSSPRDYLSLSYHPSGEMLAYGALGGYVGILDATSGVLLTELSDTNRNIGDLAYSPSGRWLVAGSDDDSIYIWKTPNYELTAQFKGHSDYVNGVAIHPDEALLVSGSHDQTLGVWDFVSQELITLLNGHEDAVLRVAFSSDGTLIASISWDGTVRLWGITAE